MINVNTIKNIYFIGIGGIGMSALARYFNEKNVLVSGYDRTPTALTRKMETEGIKISYSLAEEALNKDAELVVYTPAIAKDNLLLKWYEENGYPVYKRAAVLQEVTRNMTSITVAGTHGKTTISSMIAHILRDSGYGCHAFLGGIATNYDTNYWKSDNNNIAVIEADEYDRSFLKLNPDIAVLTAIAADHLDIYGTKEELEKAFMQYVHNIKRGGTLWYRFGTKGLASLKLDHKKKYSLQNSSADAYARNITIQDGGYLFSVVGEGWAIPGIHLQVGGMHNVENAVVAIAIAKQLEIDDQSVKAAIATFKGVKRRFQYVVKTEKVVYIDDYAHHPEELESLIRSAKTLFPHKRCVIAFQPHLYSRTRDMAAEFARSLDVADEVILLDIYPARETPIAGITAETIAKKMGNPNHTILGKDGLVNYVKYAPLELFITAGAGDIDKLVEPIKEELKIKLKKYDERVGREDDGQL